MGGPAPGRQNGCNPRIEGIFSSAMRYGRVLASVGLLTWAVACSSTTQQAIDPGADSEWSMFGHDLHNSSNHSKPLPGYNGGYHDDTGDQKSGGCGCAASRSGSNPPPVALLGLMLIGLLRGRRRAP